MNLEISNLTLVHGTHLLNKQSNSSETSRGISDLF